MKPIHLNSMQRHGKMFKHAAFNGVQSYTAEDLLPMVEARLRNGPSKPLVLALRSTARFLVGRYLWYYPATRRFLDEMVGESLLAITMLVNKLQREMLIDSHIQKLASRRIRNRIELMLNALRSVSAPALQTQHNMRKDGRAAIYLVAVREPLPDDKVCNDSEEAKYDMLDAVSALRNECDTAREILDPGNWGLSDEELARKLDVSRRDVSRCRCKLLSDFRILTGESK